MVHSLHCGIRWVYRFSLLTGRSVRELLQNFALRLVQFLQRRAFTFQEVGGGGGGSSVRPDCC